MTPNEEFLHRALRAFHRGYSGEPGVIRPRQAGKTAAGVQAVLDFIGAQCVTRDEALPAKAGDDEPPLAGRWHHGNGYLACGSFRVAGADWEAGVCEAENLRERVFDWVCMRLNEQLRPSVEPLLDAPALVGQTQFGKGVAWSSVIGCAQRRYLHKDDPKPTPEQVSEFRAALMLDDGDTRPTVEHAEDEADEPDINDDPYGCGFVNGVASLSADVADAARWRFVRELAWFVDEANRVYRERYGETSPDWDEIQDEIDKAMLAARGAADVSMESLRPSAEETMSALCLVGDTEHITDEIIATWSGEQRAAAIEWALAVHLRASDNDDVEVPERPYFTIAAAPGIDL